MPPSDETRPPGGALARPAFRALAVASIALVAAGAAGAAVGPGRAGGSNGVATRGETPPTSALVYGPGVGSASTVTLPSTTAPSSTTLASPLSEPSSGTAAGGQAGTPATGGPVGGGASGAAPSGSGGAPTSGPSRSTPATTTAPSHQLPAPGTYKYATSGSQYISVLGSSNYPPQTEIVVSGDSCGVSSVWKASSGNSQTTVECPAPGGLRVVSQSSTVSEDGYSNTQTFACGPDAFVPVTAGRPGQTWTWSCTSSNGETSAQVVKLVGPGSATVGGVSVSTVEVQVSSTLSGPEQGTANSTIWLTSNATPVKETGSVDATVSGITYKSNYTLQLLSLTPS